MVLSGLVALRARRHNLAHPRDGTHPAQLLGALGAQRGAHRHCERCGLKGTRDLILQGDQSNRSGGGDRDAPARGR